MSEKLNVVWIMSDQHAAFASGCYGHSVVHTPAIDRLASEGLRFENAYTPSPVCVPARFAAMTGCYPHTTGCTGNNTPLPHRQRTIAHAMARAGYVTAFIGKMHPVDPQTHGFDYLVDMGHYYDYLGPKVEIWGRGMDARNTGCGLPWMDQWYTPASWLGQPLSPGLPRTLDEPDHFEAFVARCCRTFLEQMADQPFFLFASLIKPHFPYASPPQFHALYHADEMELPATAFEWDDVPIARQNFLCRDLRDETVQAAARQEIADYFAATSYMDLCVGRIVAAVDELGLREKTLVIYTSDHGEMLYHHGLRQKFVFYEQSVHVPLIMRCPRVIPTGAIASLTDLTDLVPTTLAFTEVDPLCALDGVDLGPVLRGDENDVRRTCYSELGESMMARTGSFKLAWYPPNDWRLYDLHNDALEQHNLYPQWQDKAEVKMMRDNLLQWKGSLQRPNG